MSAKEKISRKTILAVDIGNTAISLGLFRNGKQARGTALATGLSRVQLAAKIRTLLRKEEYRRTEEVILCSVVPAKTAVLKQIFRGEKKPVFTVGRDIAVPLKNRYRHPRQVGQDRLVGAYAAVCLYGAPAVVIDLGTAITLDVVSSKRDYLGGMIIPGLKLSAEALNQKTALLPKVDIHKPEAMIGRDTQTSILSGIFYGYGTMIDGLIHLLKKQVRGNPAIVMTGGHCDLMKKFFRKKVKIEKDLVLKGLNLLLTSRR